MFSLAVALPRCRTAGKTGWLDRRAALPLCASAADEPLVRGDFTAWPSNLGKPAAAATRWQAWNETSLGSNAQPLVRHRLSGRHGVGCIPSGCSLIGRCFAFESRSLSVVKIELWGLGTRHRPHQSVKSSGPLACAAGFGHGKRRFRGLHRAHSETWPPFLCHLPQAV